VLYVDYPPWPARAPGDRVPNLRRIRCFRDHQQSAGQLSLEEKSKVTPRKQEGGATTRGRRPKQDDAHVGLERMGADIRDAPVQREQHAALATGEFEHHVVRRPDQTLVAERLGVMTRRSKVVPRPLHHARLPVTLGLLSEY